MQASRTSDDGWQRRGKNDMALALKLRKVAKSVLDMAAVFPTG